MYKKLLYNLIVKQEEKQIIFNDYNKCLLTRWITDLFSNISNSKIIYFYSSEYYENISEINKFIKKYRPRFVIIDTLKFPIKKQINDLLNKGIKNFIIKNNDNNNTMYNLDNFRTYLKNNNEISKKCSENNFQHDDEIFNHSKLYLTNFLIWCCIKNDNEIYSDFNNNNFIMNDKLSYVQMLFKNYNNFIDKKLSCTELFNESQIYAKNNFLSSNYTLTEFGLFMTKYFGDYKKKSNGIIKYSFPNEIIYKKHLFDRDPEYYRYIYGFEE